MIHPGIHGPKPVGPSPGGSILVLGLDQDQKKSKNLGPDEDRNIFEIWRSMDPWTHPYHIFTKNFLDKRPIVNPNDGFLSQLITYEGILNAIKNRYSFGRDHFDDGAGEQFDSDIDLHNEIRVKKLVQFIQEREKAEIRRSKSNSRSSKR